jgi:hypothetical protein
VGQIVGPIFCEHSVRLSIRRKHPYIRTLSVREDRDDQFKGALHPRFHLLTCGSACVSITLPWGCNATLAAKVLSDLTKCPINFLLLRRKLEPTFLTSTRIVTPAANKGSRNLPTFLFKPTPNNMKHMNQPLAQGDHLRHLQQEVTSILDTVANMKLLLHQLLGPRSKTSDEQSPRPFPHEPRRVASLERETSLRVQDRGPDRDDKSCSQMDAYEYKCLTKTATPPPAAFEKASDPTSPAAFDTAFNVFAAPDLRPVDPDLPDLEVDDDPAPVITIRSAPSYAPNNLHLRARPVTVGR